MKKIVVFILTLLMITSMLSPVIGASQTEATDDLLSVSSFAELKNLIDKKYKSVTNVIYDTDDEIADDDSFEEDVEDSQVGQTDDSSTTNVQVEGTDEADIVKNEGGYIYVLSSSTLKIFDARKPLSVKLISTTLLDVSDLDEMYICADRAVFVGNSYSYPFYKTLMLVYDISKKSDPQLIRRTAQDGTLKTSRRIGNYLYTVSTKSFNPFQLDSKTISIFPEFFDGKGTDEFVLERLPLKNILVPKDFNTTFTTISVVNIKNPAQGPTVRSILGGGNLLYMNQSSLYSVHTFQLNNKPITAIYKLNVSGASLTYVGSANVEGTVLNQFSMDEYESNFRIVTSNGFENNLVTVFNKNLKKIGQLSGFAKNENIKAVRFMKKLGYVVTFRNTDPLFTIDLSDPTKPKIVGQLKIPGFSEYLHPVSDTVLLGFGQSQTDKGALDGFKISLFDVSDPKRPKEIAVRYISDANSYSEAFSNHKAFVFDTARKIVAFPLRIYNRKISANVNKIALYSYANNKLAYLGAVTNAGSTYSSINRAVFIGKYFFAVCSDGITTYTISPLKKVSELSLLRVYDVTE